MKISKAALSAAVALAVLIPAIGSGLGAQALDSLKQRTQRQRPQPDQPPATAPTANTGQPAQPQRVYNLSRAERTALTPAVQAAERSDWPAVQAALPAADAAARGADAKYVIGQVRLRMGIALNDRTLQSRAIDELIASGGAQPSEMRGLYENQLEFATAAGDTAKAARAQAQLDVINPVDPTTRLVRQARIRANANDAPGAIALYQQAMQAQQAAGQPIPVEWRQQIATLAYRARMPQTVGYMREWLVAAPGRAQWHDTLAIYAELGNANDALKLDIYRLMRAAGAMTSERDYIEYGTAAGEVRSFGEVKAVFEEGLSRNLITANAAYARERLTVANRRATDDRPLLAGERTAALAGRDAMAALRLGDAYYGYGDYAPAAELYRAALAKGGDANLVNLRLGAALAVAGNRAEAETALRAVTGPRADLAQLWLLWLAQPRP